MKPILKTLSVLLLLSISCSEEPTTPTGDFDLQGRVLQKGVAVENAIVKLDDPEGIKATTDRDGYFKLLNVPKGNYELTVSKNTVDGSFSERTTSIAVDSDLNLDNLILPKGIKVYEPNNVTDETLLLNWSPTDAPDFREYKVYQHNTSGLDETTGTLIHVSTSINDTSFSVKDLNPLTDYYFRVYVMNDLGRLGGSNIVSTTTINKEVIFNGNFELIENGYPVGWSISATFNLDSTEVQNGKYSLSLSTAVKNGHTVFQTISPNEIEAGARYKLTYWMKYEEWKNGTSFSISFETQSGDWKIWLTSDGGLKEKNVWVEYSAEFNIPENLNPSNYRIIFWLEVWADPFVGWIDNFSMTKVE